MRIGLFGGTFDPVHVGHLILAEQCREQGRLDQVWFVPAARPPHKLERAITPFAQRVEMLSLAIAGYPVFRVEELEKDRFGPSYTADTLVELHARLPEAELFFILGSDSLPDLPKWHQPRRVVELATLLVTQRAGWPVPPLAELRVALQLAESTPLRLQVVEVPLIDISSSDLRRRAADNRSLRYFVPRAVECYIAEKGLYRSGSGSGSSRPHA
jgi:nicotinate-nucleotide adenylyltransferase